MALLLLFFLIPPALYILFVFFLFKVLKPFSSKNHLLTAIRVMIFSLIALLPFIKILVYPLVSMECSKNRDVYYSDFRGELPKTLEIKSINGSFDSTLSVEKILAAGV